MSAADYMLCLNCNRKAYYDSDVDYGNATVVALCYDCSRSLEFTVTRNGAPND